MTAINFNEKQLDVLEKIKGKVISLSPEQLTELKAQQQPELGLTREDFIPHPGKGINPFGKGIAEGLLNYGLRGSEHFGAPHYEPYKFAGTGIGSDIGRIGGEILPFAALEYLTKGSLGSLGLEGLGSSTALGRIAAKVLPEALTGSAYGGLGAKKGKVLENMLWGGGVGGTLGAISPLLREGSTFGARKYLGKIAGTEKMREMAKLLPKGIKDSLGLLTGSKRLLAHEKALAEQPGSALGLEKAKFRKAIEGKAQNILTDLAGKTEEKGASQHLYDTLKENYEATKNKVTKAYKDFADVGDALAIDNKIKVKKKPIIDSIVGAIDDLKKEIAEYPPFKKDFEPLLDHLETIKASKLDTFNNLKSFRKRINNEKRIAYERYPASHVRRASYNALKKIHEGITQSLEESSKPFPGLLARLKKADRIYKNELIPFEEVPGGGIRKKQSEFIKQYHSGNPDVEKVVKVHAPNVRKSPTQLKWLTERLNRNPEQKHIVGYNLLKQFHNGKSATENTHGLLKKVRELRLGGKREILFTPKMNKRISSLEKIVALDPSILKFKPTPKKGIMERIIRSTGKTAPLSIGTLGALGGIGLGHPAAGLGIGVASALAPTILKKATQSGIQKLLLSDFLRNIALGKTISRPKTEMAARVLKSILGSQLIRN